MGARLSWGAAGAWLRNHAHWTQDVDLPVCGCLQLIKHNTKTCSLRRVNVFYKGPHDNVRSMAPTGSRWARSQKPMAPSNSPPSKTYIRAGIITVSCILAEKICWPGKRGEKKNEPGEEDSECFPKEIAKIVKHHNCGNGNMFIGVIGGVESDSDGFETI